MDTPARSARRRRCRSSHSPPARAAALWDSPPPRQTPTPPDRCRRPPHRPPEGRNRDSADRSIKLRSSRIARYRRTSDKAQHVNLPYSMRYGLGVARTADEALRRPAGSYDRRRRTAFGHPACGRESSSPEHAASSGRVRRQSTNRRASAVAGHGDTTKSRNRALSE